MPIIFEMPSLSPTMEKGNLVSWCKAEGDEIAVGDVIAEIDTDKATMEVESIYKGVLAKILVPAGTHDVAVRQPIAVIRQKGDKDEDVQRAIDGLASAGVGAVAAAPVDEEVGSEQGRAFSAPPVEVGDRVKASPLAWRLASEYGVDISRVAGTGPHGRVVKDDVLAAKDAVPLQAPTDMPNGARFVDEPISSMRRVIAEKLTKSKQETPHFYMNASVNITALLNMRRQINDSGKLDTKITVNDLIVRAVALAMRDEPGVNVAWQNGFMRRFSTIDVSVAVAVEGGLLTPIVWGADQKPISAISKEIKVLAHDAKDGKLKPEQFIGGGITVSNLGMFGVNSFFSIINPPQGSILSVGGSVKTPVCDEGGDITVGDVVNIGYAVDHRVIDGGTAAKFLSVLREYLEQPLLLLV